MSDEVGSARFWVYHTWLGQSFELFGIESSNTLIHPSMQDTPLGAKILARTLKHQNLGAATFKLVAYHNKIFEILAVSKIHKRTIFFKV